MECGVYVEPPYLAPKVAMPLTQGFGATWCIYRTNEAMLEG